MLDPQKRAEAEQAIAGITEFFPALWKTMFDQLIVEGFTESQALFVLGEYIQASLGGQS